MADDCSSPTRWPRLPSFIPTHAAEPPCAISDMALDQSPLDAHTCSPASRAVWSTPSAAQWIDACVEGMAYTAQRGPVWAPWHRRRRGLGAPVGSGQEPLRAGQSEASSAASDRCVVSPNPRMTRRDSSRAAHEISVPASSTSARAAGADSLTSPSRRVGEVKRTPALRVAWYRRLTPARRLGDATHPESCWPSRSLHAARRRRSCLVGERARSASRRRAP